jgi:hypothetical protein
VTLWRFTIIGRPDIFVEVETNEYAMPAFRLARPELCEKARQASGEDKPVAVSFSECRVSKPRELVPVRLVGKERGARA